MTPGELGVLLEYHLWANRRALAISGRLDPGRFVGAPFPGGRPVRDLLVRLMTADALWLARWQGRASPMPFFASAFPDTASLGRQWQPIQDAVARFAGTVTDESAVLPLTYLTHSGTTVNQPLWQTVVQLVDRGASERGRLLASIHALGERGHHLDLGYFLRARGAAQL
ncbi:MAG: DinB family protein [Acidobacteriota bacterium]